MKALEFYSNIDKEALTLLSRNYNVKWEKGKTLPLCDFLAMGVVMTDHVKPGTQG